MYGYGYPVVSLGVAGTGLNPPVNTVAPAITGTPQVGQTLSCSTGTWSNVPTSYAYQWKRNNANILGATSATYTLVSADANTSVKCTVTATNGAGSASADSNTVSVTWETDAQAFITAASITDATQQAAVNQLVVDLKGYNIWTKMKAIYPFVGGSATSNSYNLKNTAQFQITWNGGVTHNASGITGSVNGFGNTNLAPLSALSQNNTHISAFVKTASASAGRAVMGLTDSGFANGLYFYPKLSNNIYFDVNASSGGNNPLPNTTETGHFVINRVNSTQQSAFINAISLGTSARNSSGLSNKNISILAININATNSDYYNAGTLSFSTIGDGLSNTEISNLYNLVTTFNTALGR